MSTLTILKDLYNRIPRRHTSENVVEMNSILHEYEDILHSIEADAKYEKHVAEYFDSLDEIRAAIKNSNSSKHSKKAKDTIFDEASGNLKDNVDAVMNLIEGQ